MIARSIRAVYKDGQIRPLEPVTLVEGQVIQLWIVPQQDHLQTAWDNSLGPLPLLPNGDLDEEALFQELHQETRDLRPLSAELIEERRNGP